MARNHKDDTALATKADIARVSDSIGRLHDAGKRWKNEIIRHFHAVAASI